MLAKTKIQGESSHEKIQFQGIPIKVADFSLNIDQMKFNRTGEEISIKTIKSDLQRGREKSRTKSKNLVDQNVSSLSLGHTRSFKLNLKNFEGKKDFGGQIQRSFQDKSEGRNDKILKVAQNEENENLEVISISKDDIPLKVDDLQESHNSTS